METEAMDILNTGCESLAERAGCQPPQGVTDPCSVELPMEGSDLSARVKVWLKSPTRICLVLEEDSDVLPRLNIGNTLSLIYYSIDPVCPSEYLATEILNIRKKGEGKLRGRYLVELEILKTYH
jgi:hypothetical protein